MFSKMTKATAHVVEIAIILGILILINILASEMYIRWDLTEDKQFTLHESSRRIVADLKDELRVTLYSSIDLPTGAKKIIKDIKDTIEEYKASANSNFVFLEEHPDVTNEEEVQRLQAKGINPVQISQRESARSESARGFLALLISYGDVDEQIDLRYLSGLEYRLSHTIMKLTAENIPAIGVYAGSGRQALSEQGGYNILGQVLKSQYEEVQEFDISLGNPVPDKIKTMIIISPDLFGSKEKIVLDQFIMSGGKVIFFLDTAEVDPSQALSSRAKRKPTPWADFISHYGIKVQPKLVGDLKNYTGLPVGGFFPLYYPLWPQVVQGNFGELAFTANLELVTLPWASPVETLSDRIGEEVTADYIFHTSEEGYAMDEPFNLDPNQFRDKSGRVNFQPSGELSEKQLGVMLSGVFGSYYEGKEVPTAQNDQGIAEQVWQDEIINVSLPTEIVVIGSSSMVTDGIGLNQNLPMGNSNAIFLLNMVDTLSIGQGLQALRARVVTDRQLKPDLDESDKALIKFLGTFLIPILISIVGIIRYVLQVQTRKMVEAKTLGID